MKLDRRQWLKIGSLGATGLTLPTLMAATRAAAAESSKDSFGRAKRCVLLFLTGGAPQHDTFDPKPFAPANIRGEFSPISTRIPGVHVTELFPRLAQRLHHVTLLRSVTHDDTVHTSAGYTMLTGKRHPQANAKTASDIRPRSSDHPHIGSLLSSVRPEHGPPTFVSLPEVIEDAAVNEFPGLGGGLMGERYSPLLVEGSAKNGAFTPPPLKLSPDLTAARLAERGDLLRSLNGSGALSSLRRAVDSDVFRQRAFSLLTSNSVQQSFELQRESMETRERYGSHLFGQGCLMARRLLESGVSLVTVYWHYEGPDDSPVWDTHGNNFSHLRNRLAPPTDMAMSALLDDLSVRGMLDDTLFVTLGEFGRTPKINALAGRDHWPGVATIVLAGAGVQGGAVYGSSDGQGAFPSESPVTPSDFTATLMHLLGIPNDLEIHDQSGRPFRACDGTPILGLLR